MGPQGCARLMLRLRTTSDELLNLDFLRFCASVAIVAFHSREFLFPKAERALQGERSAGLALFVDLFFLISGFVIAHVYAGRVRDLASFGRFMQRRIGRIFPLHLLTFVAAVVLWALIKRVAQADHAPVNDPSCMIRTALLLHAVFPCGDGVYYYNPVNWSISTEMAMYALFPLAALGAARWRRAFLFVAASFLAGLTAWTFRASADMLQWTLWLYYPLRALPSFLLGVALSHNRDLLVRIPGAQRLTAVALGATTIAMLRGWPAPLQIAGIAVTGVLAMAADAQAMAGSGARPSAVIRRIAPLGQLTYSIYLWHGFFILVLLNGVGDGLLGGNRTAMAGLVVLVCVGTLILSYLSWRFFETQARRWVDGLFGAGGRTGLVHAKG